MVALIDMRVFRVNNINEEVEYGPLEAILFYSHIINGEAFLSKQINEVVSIEVR